MPDAALLGPAAALLKLLAQGRHGAAAPASYRGKGVGAEEEGTTEARGWGGRGGDYRGKGLGRRRRGAIEARGWDGGGGEL